ncbi:hypothetical protein RRG08_008627 [Elysia crispata]|uniref:Uncharacterized protein n=1 Tax=Elysia crispata TaxID=231223 RepID=A0AAE0XYP7_9GAST|nr:hypothetical protein RRG08_008627 [Elysia crispata]
MLLSHLKETTLHGPRWNNSPTDSINTISSCHGPHLIPQEILQYPKRDGQMVKSLTASLVSREEEERHQRNLNEDEQLKNQIAETAQQFTERRDWMLHAPVTSLITSQATARPLWSIMFFGFWPLPSPLQLPNVEEKLYGEKYVWFSIGWYLDNW